MAQASIVISNASGAAVRAALNSALEAITTKQSGSTAPSATYPFMEWADTANDLLKQRNAANSAWITKGTLSAAYGGLPASSIVYAPGSPELLAATDVQTAIDLLAAGGGVATQADQETATDITKIVTPGRQQFHPSAIKAYALYDGTGTPAFRGTPYNVSSLTDNAAGNQTLNWAQSFSSANYSFTLGVNRSANNTTTTICMDAAASIAAGSLRISTAGGSGTESDFSHVSVMVAGDQ